MKNRIWIFLLLLISGVSLPALSGLLVFPFSLIPSVYVLLYTAIIAIVFLLSSVLLRSNEQLRSYWQIPFAFFTAAMAMFLDFLVNTSSNTMTGLVLDMALSATIIFVAVVLFTKISGNSLSSIFLRRGNLKLGLIVGFAGFFIFALTSIPLSQYLFQGQNLTIGRVFAWLPWLLPTVLLNGVREETLYRGLFLNKFSPKLGLQTSNILQATVFSMSHSVAGIGFNTYTPFIWGLVIFTFILGLAWGYLMQRTNGMLGSVLFHAGTDIPVFLGIFSNTF